MSKEYGVKVKFGSRTEEVDGQIQSKEWKAFVKVETDDNNAEIAGYWRGSKEETAKEAHEMLMLAVLKYNKEPKHYVINSCLYMGKYDPVIEGGKLKHQWRIYALALSETGRIRQHYVGAFESCFEPYSTELAEWLEKHKGDLPVGQCEVIRKQEAPALALVAEA